MIDAINGAVNPSTGSLNRIDKNYEDFLVLLTTQLRNQDPSDPTDTNQLTQQIATLSQVEQQLKTNENLERLVSMYQATQYNSIVSYIGKQIEAEGNVGALSNGNAEFSYNLEGNATEVTYTIRDADGNMVREQTLSGAKLMGSHTYIWDGVDNQGNVMPAGVYTLSVSAKNGNSDVTATGGDAQLKHTTPQYVYYLAQAAAQVKITIKDSSGAVIRTDNTDGTKVAGRNEYIWDGKDNNGNAMPEGQYTIEVAATDAQDAEIVSRTFITGVVTSIDSAGGQAYLSIGDIAIPLQQVTSIRLADLI